MTKETLGKIFVTFVILTLVFSFAACSEDAVVDPEEGETPDPETEPEEMVTLPETMTIELHPDLELAYSNEEEGLYAYVTEENLETMFDFYNNMPIFTASSDFATSEDVFMVKTELYDIIEQMGGVIEGNDDLEEWEDEISEAYDNSEGVVTVVGVRGGTEEYADILPEEIHSHVPDEGSLIYFARLIDPPITE